MNDKEKLIKIITEGEQLIDQKVDADSNEFISWSTKVERFLIKKYGDQSLELSKFRGRSFRPILIGVGSNHDSSVECIRDISISISEFKIYLEELEDDEITKGSIEKAVSHNINKEKIFIIHGHDGEIKEAVARLLEKLGIFPIILNEQVNQGQTIIEKFERYANIGAAIALFTNDDCGQAKDAMESQPRARQNVVFETGYFIGKFGRDRVILIAEKGIEIPSDLQGVVYTDRNNWQFDVCKELNAMGYLIDLNKLIA